GGDQITAVTYFEEDLLVRLAEVVGSEKASRDSYRRADVILSAVLRDHLRVRQTEPTVDPLWLRLEGELRAAQSRVRGDWLNHLTKTDPIAAVRLTDQWLPHSPRTDPLVPFIRKLWTDQARDALDKADYKAARVWADRMDVAFGSIPDDV